MLHSSESSLPDISGDLVSLPTFSPCAKSCANPSSAFLYEYLGKLNINFLGILLQIPGQLEVHFYLF